MQKVKLNFELDDHSIIRENQLAVYLHGLLLEIMSDAYADKCHNSQLNPYSQYVLRQGNYYQWIIHLLTDEASQEIGDRLMASDFKSFKIKAADNLLIHIQGKEVAYLAEKQLAELFYQESASSKLRVEFLSPCSFKQAGRNIIYPDIRLIFQSLIQRYTAFIDQSDEEVNQELLAEIVNAVEITSYRLRTDYFKVHNHPIPAFRGNIHIKIHANQTLKNYIYSLLRFGEYSGLGVKTAMGMGALVVKER